MTDEYDSQILWAFHWFFTVLNPIILINLLISLMGETFGRVQENREIADSLELIQMIIEGETLLFWRRNQGEKKYLQICMQEEDLEEVEDDETQKLRKLKSQVLEVNEKVDNNFKGYLKSMDSLVELLKRHQK